MGPLEVLKGRISSHRRRSHLEASFASPPPRPYAIRRQGTLKTPVSADIPLRVTLLTVAPYSVVTSTNMAPDLAGVALSPCFSSTMSRVESQETSSTTLLSHFGRTERPRGWERACVSVMCQAYERRITTWFNRDVSSPRPVRGDITVGVRQYGLTRQALYGSSRREIKH